MEKLILKQEIVDKIKCDMVLYGKVASALSISILSARRVLKANSPRLTQASVLKVLKEHLKVSKDSELLTDATENVAA